MTSSAQEVPMTTKKKNQHVVLWWKLEIVYNFAFVFCHVLLRISPIGSGIWLLHTQWLTLFGRLRGWLEEAHHQSLALRFQSLLTSQFEI